VPDQLYSLDVISHPLP